MLDWSRPLVAVGYQLELYATPQERRPVVDYKYHRAPNHAPVRFPVNLWAKGAAGGTWYFSDDGHAIASRDATGKPSALYHLRNLEKTDD